MTTAVVCYGQRKHPLKSVAAHVGCTSESAFASAFKRGHGLAPVPTGGVAELAAGALGEERLGAVTARADRPL
ncbi:hypothetical protein [Streptomyces sp. AB3(2024)]|uniref:hypothetical protein n=1 Tax=Streptomyces sp. AB3(2024) TaxID=3317321 RepID=UPI0035A2ED08